MSGMLDRAELTDQEVWQRMNRIWWNEKYAAPCWMQNVCPWCMPLNKIKCGLHQ